MKIVTEMAIRQMCSVLLSIVVFLPCHPCQAAPSPNEKLKKCPTISDVATDVSSLVKESGRWMWRKVKKMYNSCEDFFVGKDGFFTTFYYSTVDQNKPPKAENPARKCCVCRCKHHPHQQNADASQPSGRSTQTGDKPTGATPDTRNSGGKACGISVVGCACVNNIGYSDSAKGLDSASSKSKCNCGETCKAVGNACEEVAVDCFIGTVTGCVKVLQKCERLAKDCWEDFDGEECAKCCLKWYCRIGCCCCICKLFTATGGSGGSGTVAGGGGTQMPSGCNCY